MTAAAGILPAMARAGIGLGIIAGTVLLVMVLSVLIVTWQRRRR